MYEYGKRKMKRAVLFDLIGTLLVAKTTRPLSSLYEIFNQFGLMSSCEEFTTIWEAENSLPSQHNHTPFEERIARVAGQLRWKIDWKFIEAIANDICDEAATVLSVDAEAPNLIKRLQGKVKLGIVTNYDHPPAIYKLLSNTKLDQSFSVVIISGEIGIWKPDPKILYTALEEMSLKASDCLFVGDSSDDIEAAISAVIEPILISRNNDLLDPFRNPEIDLESKYSPLIKSQGLHIIRELSEVEKFL
jgi:putative hydrolase of the HAD superfamily